MPRYEVEGCDVIWTIKDHAISHTFFDEGAATFFLPHLNSERMEEEERKGAVVEVSLCKRTKYALDRMLLGTHEGSDRSEEVVAASGKEKMVGVALGPDWHANLKMTGKEADQVRISPLLHSALSSSSPPLFPLHTYDLTILCALFVMIM